jgi:predicted amidohydrolase
VVGLLGGIDHLAPEVARSLSALGATVLVGVVDADARCGPDLLGALAQLRAIENGVPVLIIDPSGTVRAAAASGAPVDVVADGEVSLATLAIEATAGNAAPGAVPRRPDLYGQLVRDGREDATPRAGVGKRDEDRN